MARAKVDPEAEAAFLAKIVEIAEDNPNVADALIDRFDEVLRLIGENPQAFARGKIKGTRKFTMRPFAMTYRIRNGQAEIGAIKVRGQKDAYAPKNMGAGSKTTAAERIKLELAGRIVTFAEANGSEIPNGAKYAVDYLADVAREDELQAMVKDLANLDDFVDFMVKHSITYPTSGFSR